MKKESLEFDWIIFIGLASNFFTLGNLRKIIYYDKFKETLHLINIGTVNRQLVAIYDIGSDIPLA